MSWIIDWHHIWMKICTKGKNGMTVIPSSMCTKMPLIAQDFYYFVIWHHQWFILQHLRICSLHQCWCLFMGSVIVWCNYSSLNSPCICHNSVSSCTYLIDLWAKHTPFLRTNDEREWQVKEYKGSDSAAIY